MHTGGHEEITALVWRRIVKEIKVLGSEDHWGGGGVSPQSTMWTLGVELRLVAWQELSPPAELSPSFTIGSVKFISAPLLCFLGI